LTTAIVILVVVLITGFSPPGCKTITVAETTDAVDSDIIKIGEYEFKKSTSVV